MKQDKDFSRFAMTPAVQSLEVSICSFVAIHLSTSFKFTPNCFNYIVYWSWNGGPREGRGVEALEKGGQISGGGGAGGGWDSVFENEQSAKVNNIELGIDLYKSSTEITGAKWPDVSAVRSPCPTLNVVGAISKAMIEKEELKRMEERPGFDAEGKVIKLTKRKKVKRVAQKVVGGVVRRTVGRVGGFVSRRLLGRVPETALEGSFQEEKPEEENVLLKTVEPVAPETAVPTQSDKDLLNQEISTQIFEGYQDSQLDEPDMKSDEQLLKDLMSRKKEKNSSVA